MLTNNDLYNFFYSLKTTNIKKKLPKLEQFLFYDFRVNSSSFYFSTTFEVSFPKVTWLFILFYENFIQKMQQINFKDFYLKTNHLTELLSTTSHHKIRCVLVATESISLWTCIIIFIKYRKPYNTNK